MPPQALKVTVSKFTPLTSSPGGTLTIYLNGQVVAVWDAKDMDGRVVPNGFYHMTLTQAFTDRSQEVLNFAVYVDPRSQVSSVNLVAQPNITHTDGNILFSGMVGGKPVSGANVFKVFTLNGELVKTLDAVNGQAVWNLTNLKGEKVASGLYLISLNVMDPLTWTPAHKTVKVVVLR
jgi:hypothetical protein